MKQLLAHFLRIDARSLGLFRLLFGSVLLSDLCRRWDDVIAFYSNDGVLPNHNHIFNLKNGGQLVWSALHACSSAGESKVVFTLIFVFYVMFLVGYKTRVSHALALVSLVSLSARNTLAEGPGEAIAIAILALTLFLPLGSRWSLDAFLERWTASREVGSEDLNQRGLPTEPEIDQMRLPGWSPWSLAAIGVLAQISLLMLALAMQQTGPAWADGTALGKAMHVHLFASPAGFSVRDAGWLAALTRVLGLAQWAIPALLVAPVLRGPMRLGAATLLVVHGLTYGLLTNLGLFGWTIAASAALVLSSDTWRYLDRHVPSRVVTIIYDVDCGICYLLCKILRRLDVGGHLVFQGNDLFGQEAAATYREEPASPKLLVYSEKKKTIEQRDLPTSITAELVDATVVVVGADGAVTTRGRAVGLVLLALPGLRWLGWLILLPGVRKVADFKYDFFAKRRTRVSVELGLAACGTPREAGSTRGSLALAPSTAIRFAMTSAVREVLALVLVASVVTTTSRQNPVGFQLPENGTLAGVSWWLRTPAPWAILAPEPPTTTEKLAVDGSMREGGAIDPLTGEPPTITFDAPFRLGSTWARYIQNLRGDAARDYQNAFKMYLARRGPRWDPAEADKRVLGIDAFWVQRPAFGGDTTNERVFRHGRGGGGVIAAPPPAAVPGRPPQITRPVEPQLEQRPDPNDPISPEARPQSPGQE